jgi:hypothetical protein
MRLSWIGRQQVPADAQTRTWELWASNGPLGESWAACSCKRLLWTIDPSMNASGSWNPLECAVFISRIWRPRRIFAKIHQTGSRGDLTTATSRDVTTCQIKSKTITFKRAIGVFLSYIFPPFPRTLNAPGDEPAQGATEEERQQRRRARGRGW